MMNQKPFRGIQINKTHPLAKGLVGAWIFNELTGSDETSGTIPLMNGMESCIDAAEEILEA